MRTVLALACAILLPACVARTAWDVATLPVRAGAKVVDWTTTSQDEADRNAGRKMRHAREREEKAARKAAKEERRAQRQELRRERRDGYSPG